MNKTPFSKMRFETEMNKTPFSKMRSRYIFTSYEDLVNFYYLAENYTESKKISLKK